MAEASVKVDVSEIIKAHVMNAVVEGLSKDGDQMLRAVVAEALNAKADHYGRKTLLQEMCEKLIREAATNVFRKWVSDNQAKIEKAMTEHINAKGETLVKSLANSLLESVGRSEIYVTGKFVMHDEE